MSRPTPAPPAPLKKTPQVLLNDRQIPKGPSPPLPGGKTNQVSILAERQRKGKEKKKPEATLEGALKQLGKDRAGGLRALARQLSDETCRAAGERVLAALEPLLADRSSEVAGRAVSAAAAVGVGLRTEGARWFRWVFAQLHGPAEAVRLPVLQAVGEAASFAALLSLKLQKFLETSTSESALAGSVPVLEALARLTQGACFQPNFPDLVDILLGFLVDPAATADTRALATRALGALAPLWPAHGPFAETLLSHLAADLAAAVAANAEAAAARYLAAFETVAAGAGVPAALEGPLGELVAAPAPWWVRQSRRVLALLPSPLASQLQRQSRAVLLECTPPRLTAAFRQEGRRATATPEFHAAVRLVLPLLEDADAELAATLLEPASPVWRIWRHADPAPALRLFVALLRSPAAPATIAALVAAPGPQPTLLALLAAAPPDAFPQVAALLAPLRAQHSPALAATVLFLLERFVQAGAEGALALLGDWCEAAFAAGLDLEALEALAAHPAPVQAPLPRLLRHPDPRVRPLAAHLALRLLPGQAPDAPLLQAAHEALAREPDEPVYFELVAGILARQPLLALDLHEPAPDGPPLPPAEFQALMEWLQGGRARQGDRWAAWECARLCTAQRLRTHWGGPAQTFTQIEELSRALAEPGADPARGRFLLAFIYDLEVQIHNAHSGSALLPAAAKNTTLFFRTNRKVCEDWISRIRHLLLRAAVALDATADILHHGAALLTQLKHNLLRAAVRDGQQFKRDLEYAVVQVGRAMLRARDGDALHGLVAWARRIKNTITAKQPTLVLTTALPILAVPVLPAMLQHARGLYQAAAAQYAGLLTEAPSLQPETAQHLASLLMQCQLATGQWARLGEWASLAEQRGWATSPRPHSAVLLETWATEGPAAARAEAPRLPLSLDEHVVFSALRADWPARPALAAALADLPRLLGPERLEVVGRLQAWAALHPAAVGPPAHPASLAAAALAQRAGPIDDAWTLETARLARASGNPAYAEELLLLPAPALPVLLEQAKLQWARGQREAAVRLLADGLPGAGEAGARGHLLLARWLLKERSAAGIAAAVLCLPDSDPELLAGACLERAAALPKAQLLYGDWAYRLGHALINTSTLLPQDSAQLAAIVGTAGKAFLQGVVRLLQTNAMDTSADDDQEEGEVLAGAVAALLAEDGLDAGQAGPVVELLLSVRRRSLSYYSTAVRAYCTHLAAGDDSVAATLRLLRLLAKYGPALADDLARLASTPTRPWQAIVPQLFSRLAHHHPYVRAQVLALLGRVGAENPNLIVYPAVVGAAANPQVQAFTEMRAQLAAQAPRLVEGVQVLIAEFTRITVLWEEHWVHGLLHLQADLHARLRTLATEVQRFRKAHAAAEISSRLSALKTDGLGPVEAGLAEEDKARILLEKYHAVMRPIILRLEALLRETVERPAETPHERWFAKTHTHVLNNMLAVLRHPADRLHPERSVEALKELMKDFQRYLKPSVLKLADISPVLAALPAAVPLPGVHAGPVITLEALERSVLILPTKTRPKKLFARGSDGRQYAYLLKGREDLHLDERVMQFLGIVNSLLAADKSARRRALRARHYAVIPLSGQSGLIQWVDRAPPLFSLYKQWQQREAAAQPDKEAKAARPADLFYARLLPALKDKGITNVSSRREWPDDVLRRVWQELASATPAWLFARELLVASPSPLHWATSTQTFARSSAVMSIIGYLIGLGDRHLDNILLDLSSGEVVHIDYNVCFEKGLKLRVPERVPFRLSQNIEHAMGFAGVQGWFSVAAELVLHVLRRSKETLLTLLEAFVYDPVVDWTADKEDDHARKHIELNVSLSLFASRVDEVQASLEETLAKVQNVLPALAEHLAEIYDVLGPRLPLHAAAHASRQAQAAARESRAALALRQHELTQRMSGLSTDVSQLDAYTELRRTLERLVADGEAWQQTHARPVAALLRTGLAPLPDPTTCLPLTHFTALLPAHAAPIAAKCQALDAEWRAQGVGQYAAGLRLAALLEQYRAVARAIPAYTEARPLLWARRLVAALADEPLPELPAGGGAAPDRYEALHQHVALLETNSPAGAGAQVTVMLPTLAYVLVQVGALALQCLSEAAVEPLHGVPDDGVFPANTLAACLDDLLYLLRYAELPLGPLPAISLAAAAVQALYTGARPSEQALADLQRAHFELLPDADWARERAALVDLVPWARAYLARLPLLPALVQAVQAIGARADFLQRLPAAPSLAELLEYVEQLSTNPNLQDEIAECEAALYEALDARRAAADGPDVAAWLAEDGGPSAARSELLNELQRLSRPLGRLGELGQRLAQAQRELLQQFRYYHSFPDHITKQPSITQAQLAALEQAASYQAAVVAGLDDGLQRLHALCTHVLHFEALRGQTPEVREMDARYAGLLEQYRAQLGATADARAHVGTLQDELDEVTRQLGAATEAERLAGEQLRETEAAVRQLQQRPYTLPPAAVAGTQDALHDLHQLASSLQASTGEIADLLANIIKITERERVDEVHELASELAALQQKVGESLARLGSEVARLLGPLHGQALEQEAFEEERQALGEACGALLARLHALTQAARDYDAEFVAPEQEELSQEVGAADPQRSSPRDRERPEAPPKAAMNAHAVSVLKRVKLKLEGRDRDPAKKQSVEEQVDWIIKEAQNPSNLAQMYEGWTSWI